MFLVGTFQQKVRTTNTVANCFWLDDTLTLVHCYNLTQDPARYLPNFDVIIEVSCLQEKGKKVEVQKYCGLSEFLTL